MRLAGYELNVSGSDLYSLISGYKETFKTLSEMKAGLEAMETQLSNIIKRYQKSWSDQQSSDSLCIPIHTFMYDNNMLSMRLCNVLINNNVYTIRDILAYTEKELLSFRGFGKECLSEVKSILDYLNVKLREDKI